MATNPASIQRTEKDALNKHVIVNPSTHQVTVLGFLTNMLYMTGGKLSIDLDKPIIQSNSTPEFVFIVLQFVFTLYDVHQIDITSNTIPTPSTLNTLNKYLLIKPHYTTFERIQLTVRGTSVSDGMSNLAQTIAKDVKTQALHLISPIDIMDVMYEANNTIPNLTVELTLGDAANKESTLKRLQGMNPKFQLLNGKIVST